MIRFIRAVFNSIIIVIVIGLAAVFLLPRAFGYQPYMVVSASMQQTFPVGSLIFVRDITPEEVQVGDPVTFRSGTLSITHRVIAIDRANRTFTTKGDNNNASEQISFDSVKGKALDFCIPQLGYFAAWFITSSGRLTTILVLLSMAVLSFALGRFIEDEPEESVQSIIQSELNAAQEQAPSAEAEAEVTHDIPDSAEAIPAGDAGAQAPGKEGDTL